jgi:hypothetical protein
MQNFNYLAINQTDLDKFLTIFQVILDPELVLTQYIGLGNYVDVVTPSLVLTTDQVCLDILPKLF